MFRHDDSENAEIIAGELTAEQWLDLARQVAEAGTLELLITGGEPMLRSDFCEIWAGIYKLGFITTLYTNATLVTEKIMDTLQKYPPHKIGITVYGASPETYKKVCGSGAAFYRMIDGIKKLSELPSGFEFRKTIIKDNYCDIDKIDSLLEHLGIQQNAVLSEYVSRPVRGGCAEVDDCRLPPEEQVELLNRIRARAYRKAVENKYGSLDSFEMKMADNSILENTDTRKKEGASFYGCDAGIKKYCITWKGKLIGCQVFDNFSVDVKEKSFVSAWDEYPYCIGEFSVDNECLDCKIKDFCYSCIAFRYAEAGNLTCKSEYACRQAHYINKLKQRGIKYDGIC